MMLIRELIGPIKEKLNEITTKPEEINENDDENLISLEAAKELATFKTYLTNGLQDKCVANRDSLKKIYNLFAKRWERITNTDAIPCHNYETYINKISLFAAIRIGDITGDHPYKILMPTLKLKEMPNCQLNELVLSDDNTTFIDVVKCLDNFRKDVDEVRLKYAPSLTLDETIENGRKLLRMKEALQKGNIKQCLMILKEEFTNAFEFKHTHPVNFNHDKLSISEIRRVIFHSKYSKAYFTSIIASLENNVNAEENIENCRNSLKAHIGKIPVSSSYGNPGVKKILELFYGDISNCDEMVLRLLEFPKGAWLEFLNVFEFDELTELILGKKLTQYENKANHQTNFELIREDFKKIMTNTLNYSRYEKNNQATLFVFAYYYRKLLIERPQQFTTSTGKYTGHSKDEKLAAIALLINFLLNEKVTLTDFKTFLDSDECAKLRDCLLENSLVKAFKTLAMPLTMFGNVVTKELLHTLTEQIMKVLDPNFNEVYAVSKNKTEKMDEIVYVR